MDALTHHRGVVELASRLAAEFAGVLVPGQVMRLVYQADRLVLRSARRTEQPVALCEQIARRLLDDRVARQVARRDVA
ncbi:hypothetical protein [Aeromicrobium wangtongii]|uniref:hypothetical protein n=1 Tax=Aeromicrobium wangtongii TaxID=2969247 RepID=UPI0020174D5E|nr:hypothetical protein [Aeromicrobium wangtongii]MCL3819286.1 hypothetical protein [Aeromicrobium wangtongii]